ncbi:TPA: tyrosine-type recombinase/integrase [Vibrio parahaemolyticus]
MPVELLRGFERWDFYSPIDDNLKMVDADFTPFISYKNGLPCYEANMYMHSLLLEGMSRKVNGGTLKTYASCIVHLIRFCEISRINFSDLNDASFRLFVQNLQVERNQFYELSRSNNRVRDIALRCLKFLMFVQRYHDLEYFIGEGEHNAITVKIEKHTISIEGTKNKKVIETISHTCVPSKDAVNRKLPVSDDDALKVWEHVQGQKNRQKRVRDIALYQCMEQLGARVTEIHLITVDDFENARSQKGNPYIKLTNLKRRDGTTTRSIPIPLSLLRDINKYIKVRKKVIKKLGINDHGFLFISLTTGKQFSSSSWTFYLNLWKRELGIEGELHPHLYRHAFITNKLKEIILQYKDINSEDEFRKHILNTEKFKMQLQQWTGHTNVHSLDRYIHLVFEDLKGYTEVYSSVALKSSVTIVKRQISELRRQIKEKEATLTEGLTMIDDILDAFEGDIDNAIKS